MASMHDLSQYIVFDLETTGLSRYDEIIEIGALKVQDGEVQDTFAALVRPRCPIQPAASMINGITDSMVRNAPFIEEVLPDFFGFAGELLVVGHNITTFDLPFIRRFAGREGAFFAQTYIDTLALAKDRLPRLGSYSLSTLCDYFRIDPQSRHRALGDCYSTNECFLRLMDPDLCDISPNRSMPARKQKRVVPFAANYSEDTAGLRELHVLLMDITSDQRIDPAEVLRLGNWLLDHQNLRGNYPYDRIYEQVEKALEDGVLTEEELDRLLSLFLSCLSPVGKISCDGEFCLNGKCICVSGEFKYGSRSDVKTLMESHGAIWKDGVTGKTDILIVGENGSAAWALGSYGGKIKKAMELRASGCAIEIWEETKISIFRCE